ncbi:MAG: SDR family oxidoreductase [Chloroflexota bacterium]|nr:SDR family oxidoreductase [Chloroflexota bacterium]
MGAKENKQHLVMGTSSRSVRERYELTGRVAVITGGVGMLGIRHGETVAELGGIPVLIDLDRNKLQCAADQINEKYGSGAVGLVTDITSQGEVEKLGEKVMADFGRIDILINNAANNPTPSEQSGDYGGSIRLEKFSMERWLSDLSVGLNGAFLCSRVFGTEMAKAKQGVILNIGSDLGIIGPDQRLYRRDGYPLDKQPVKPVTYSVIKSGLMGLTRYLATYWAESGIRANLIAPGGVRADQDPEFIERVSNLIPLGRLAEPDEYKAAVAFLISDASSYMTGAIISVDGGRTCW